MSWEYAARSDRGLRRPRNEDALLVAPERRLFAVADGMGGHAAGDVASALVIATLDAAIPSPPSPRIGASALAHRLSAAFAAAQQALVAHSQANRACAGMGTTMTALAVLRSEPGCVIAHIGDSRAYRLRDGELRLLTRDHTWVQQQVDLGMLSPAQASSHPYGSVLVRVLGGGGEPGPADVILADFRAGAGGSGRAASGPPRSDAESQPRRAGDLFLLCTDGLSGVVAHSDLQAILAQPLTTEELADQLVAAAYVRGAPDNITLVLVRPR
jgi:protein phosphatase